MTKLKKGLLNIEREEVEGSKKYFEKYLVQSNMNECVKGHIRDWIENAAFITDEGVQKKERYEAVEKIYRENKSELLKFITTANNFEGYKIIDYYGIVSGEVVIGTGLLTELDASFSDFLGEKSKSMAKKIATTKSVAQEMLIKNAVTVGGNAVVALNYDIVTFSNNLIGILVNGTAVKIKKIEC